MGIDQQSFDIRWDDLTIELQEHMQMAVPAPVWGSEIFFWVCDI